MGGRVIVKCFIILVTYVASMVIGNEMGGVIDERCDQTPHPSQCKTLLIQHPTVRSTTEFLQVSVERTLDGAMKAKRDTYSLGAQFDSKQREKGAWEDCMELYEQTVQRLNQSVSCPEKACSRSDVQAWLSTALTNLDTCREGMSELGISSDDSLQSMLQSITIDVINALAINTGIEMKTNGNGYDVTSSEVAMKTLWISQKVDVVVAQDGSGNYKSIQEAVDGRPKGSSSHRYVIHVKQGVYREYVNVGINSKYIMIVGDGMGKTIITGNKSNGGGFSTFKSATFVAEGDGFVARDITIRNTAGPGNDQAVALRSDSDMSVFYRCSIEGYQDTLYVHSARQFFKECHIYGTVDYIFGNAAALFDNCRIFARNPPSRVNTITAQGRVNPNQTTGFVIHNCVVKGAPGVQLRGVKTYLGRPWRAYARTVVMETFLDLLIEPKGWLDWGNPMALTTLYYGEYLNSGPGSGTKYRVDWPGFHLITDVHQARQFALLNFIDAA